MFILACSAQDLNRAAVLPIFNNARSQVNPPCDYRNAGSPCNGKRRNKLPDLSWSSALVDASDSFATLCPTQSNLNLPKGMGQLWVRSTRTTDSRSAAETIADAARQWVASGGYDANTGVARGPIGRAFKQIVNGANTQVGCAVNMNCPRGRSVVCTFQVAPTSTPAYPVLVVDQALKTQFRDSLITWVNRARSIVRPIPKAGALAPVQWDDALAASAQTVAEKQRGQDFKFDDAFATTETWFRGRTIYANPAFSFVAKSFTAGVLYRLDTNVCADAKGVPKTDCGLYTQLAGSDVSKVGCGWAYNQGATWVVCHWDKSFSNRGQITVKPYE